MQFSEKLAAEHQFVNSWRRWKKCAHQVHLLCWTHEKSKRNQRVWWSYAERITNVCVPTLYKPDV